MDQGSESFSGGDRAQWLAELAHAIGEAQIVAWKLGAAGQQSAEALDLYCRLEAAGEEISRLQRGGWRTERNEIDPYRTCLAQRTGAKLRFDGP